MTDFERKTAMRLLPPSVYGCIATKRGPGRPVSVGTGHKLTVYLPIKTLDILNRLTSEWSGSKSEIIQEALARYAADLDAVIQEGESHG